MDKILKRDEYINEVLNPMMEKKKYDELKMVNEGLLKNLFGVVKNLFKKDWDSIKGDPSIIDAYKEIDDKLTGYSMMKLSKKGECNQIRQALVDFADDWYELKMNKAKDNDADPKPAKSMKFKDDTLKDNLDILQKKIRDIAGEDVQMKKWADRLLDDMKVVINKSILNDTDDEDTKNEIEKQIDDQIKKDEIDNKKMLEWENSQLEQLEKERKLLITNVKATPENGDTSGDKEVGKLIGSLKLDSKEEFVNSANNDKLLGFNEIFKKSNGSKGVNISDRSYNILSAFYKQLNADAKKFNETPAQSVQAMCIAMNVFTKMCGMENPKFDDLKVELMTRCAIISNGAISYKLPLNGKEGKEAGNYFTDVIGKLTQGKLSDNSDIKLDDKFKNNSIKVFDEIKKKVKELEEDFNKKRDEDLKKLNEKES